ncbi:type II toxin-antitoxin system RelB/DinJ family antitoxin [Limosilactobacillus antri]|uniref:Addiction module antitoxin, RelB/DinJ family n=1 Tax=Limosilactobacillus antri DSM 16041 TaxID=525309 RepID=C8PA45_9LACO|nr:type II toxin-antitoxin system RelB/DinJ family antitoxin [Limosilactobacillus antri]EEW52645.1 addiction module antitoxin, RelB/DinJ family [Limosilactobacillus antri DSM 16041]KRK53716.1 hypothetical protein FC31_GL001795 [Limosilactobacillus antri DSM 16041]
MPTKVKKVQVNVDRTTADNAEEIMKEIGVTPSVVVNTLYKEIEATGKIPLSFSLTPRQRAEMELNRATQDLPVKHLRTQKELEDFFDED